MPLARESAPTQVPADKICKRSVPPGSDYGKPTTAGLTLEGSDGEAVIVCSAPDERPVSKRSEPQEQTQGARSGILVPQRTNRRSLPLWSARFCSATEAATSELTRRLLLQA